MNHGNPWQRQLIAAGNYLRDCLISQKPVKAKIRVATPLTIKIKNLKIVNQFIRIKLSVLLIPKGKKKQMSRWGYWGLAQNMARVLHCIDSTFKISHCATHMVLCPATMKHLIVTQMCTYNTCTPFFVLSFYVDTQFCFWLIRTLFKTSLARHHYSDD